MEGPISQMAGLLATAVLIALIIYAWRGRKRHAIGDGPEDEQYRVYTREFDLELPARSVLDALPGASLDRAAGHVEANRHRWKQCARRTDILVAGNGALADELLPELRAAADGLDPADLAVALLIDQSGSMKGEPIAHAAATADLLTRLISALGARSEVLGFSTAGWRGGRAYEAWKSRGRPARPGRLCALMHVIYKSADEPMLEVEARRLIVNPDLLRENVDGEAILWARDRLGALPERHKLLLVISDGAPVDDATLTHNGPSILHRHVLKVIEVVGTDQGLTLGAVGIEHRVSGYYALSETASLKQLSRVGARMLARLIAAAKEKAGFPPPLE